MPAGYHTPRNIPIGKAPGFLAVLGNTLTNVASCGDTVEEACANLDDAVTLYLNGIETNGTRERVFKEKGIVLRDTWPDVWTVPYDTFDFDVMLKARVHSLPAVQV